MPHLVAPISLAQIHSIYTSDASSQDKTSTRDIQKVSYSKSSFGGREPGHPGHPPPLPEPKGKKGHR